MAPSLKSDHSLQQLPEPRKKACLLLLLVYYKGHVKEYKGTAR